MIRKLRRKFILTNMVLVSLVLAMVFAVLVGSNFQRLRAQSDAALLMALQWDGEEGPPRFQFDAPPDAPREEEFDQPRWDHDLRQAALFPVFSVTVDAAGTVTATHTGDNVAVSDALVAQAAAQALAQNAGSGTLSALGLRFRLEAEETATRIAFVDLRWERESLRTLVVTSLLIGLGALAGFFLISLFLSRLAVKPVEQAWQQQRQFVADASHELKTPLTVILANTGIVLSHPGDAVADQRKWLEYTREEAQQMKGLVDDLLFLAKSDAQRETDLRLPVSLSEVVSGCLLPFEPVAFEAGVTLESQVEPDLVVSGDEGQLRRLVMILLDNAVKYAGVQGRVHAALKAGQDKVRLSVYNTGEPIPPQHLPHLFERFYRSDSARTREAGGYGLGLAIARSIAEGHRGKIAVASDISGTVFTVTLPLRKT